MLELAILTVIIDLRPASNKKKKESKNLSELNLFQNIIVCWLNKYIAVRLH